MHRLVELSQCLPIQSVPLSEIDEVDEAYWFDIENQKPTCRVLLEHMKLVQEVDPEFPIILDADGRVMDGMHRIIRALLENQNHLKAVQFEVTPAPDHVGCDPKELPY